VIHDGRLVTHLLQIFDVLLQLAHLCMFQVIVFILFLCVIKYDVIDDVDFDWWQITAVYRLFVIRFKEWDTINSTMGGNGNNFTDFT